MFKTLQQEIINLRKLNENNDNYYNDINSIDLLFFYTIGNVQSLNKKKMFFTKFPDKNKDLIEKNFNEVFSKEETINLSIMININSKLIIIDDNILILGKNFFKI
jgi:hypothetical protein